MPEDKNFEKMRKTSEDYYSSIGEVYSPYFNETIAFNSKGLKHIKFKKDSVVRSRADQFMRFKYIRYAQQILETSTTLQEYKERETPQKIKVNGRKEKILQKTKYYAFIAIIKDNVLMKRLKIIVKQVAGGKKYFWSIIPFWSRNKQLKLHSGDLEEE